MILQLKINVSVLFYLLSVYLFYLFPILRFLEKFVMTEDLSTCIFFSTKNQLRHCVGSSSAEPTHKLDILTPFGRKCHSFFAVLMRKEVLHRTSTSALINE